MPPATVPSSEGDSTGSSFPGSSAHEMSLVRTGTWCGLIQERSNAQSPMGSHRTTPICEVILIAVSRGGRVSGTQTAAAWRRGTYSVGAANANVPACYKRHDLVQKWILEVDARRVGLVLRQHDSTDACGILYTTRGRQVRLCARSPHCCRPGGGQAAARSPAQTHCRGRKRCNAAILSAVPWLYAP